MHCERNGSWVGTRFWSINRSIRAVWSFSKDRGFSTWPFLSAVRSSPPSLLFSIWWIRTHRLPYALLFPLLLFYPIASSLDDFFRPFASSARKPKFIRPGFWWSRPVPSWSGSGYLPAISSWTLRNLWAFWEKVWTRCWVQSFVHKTA